MSTEKGHIWKTISSSNHQFSGKHVSFQVGRYWWIALGGVGDHWRLWCRSILAVDWWEGSAGVDLSTVMASIGWQSWWWRSIEQQFNEPDMIWWLPCESFAGCLLLGHYPGAWGALGCCEPLGLGLVVPLHGCFPGYSWGLWGNMASGRGLRHEKGLTGLTLWREMHISRALEYSEYSIWFLKFVFCDTWSTISIKLVIVLFTNQSNMLIRNDVWLLPHHSQLWFFDYSWSRHEPMDGKVSAFCKTSKFHMATASVNYLELKIWAVLKTSHATKATKKERADILYPNPFAGDLFAIWADSNSWATI